MALLLTLVATLVLPSVALRPMRLSMATTSEKDVKLNPRDERRRLMKSPNYNRCVHMPITDYNSFVIS
jgi:hypothetical protein